jgi:TetR/AcrR family transcriptional regulator, mexJK operon transcriptional repressor
MRSSADNPEGRVGVALRVGLGAVTALESVAEPGDDESSDLGTVDPEESEVGLRAQVDTRRSTDSVNADSALWTRIKLDRTVRFVGDRRALRAATKKEQIAGAARSLFLAQGYAGTTMDGVSSVAGVSKQTLYSYFPSKADLLAEILDEEIASLWIGEDPMPAFDTLAELRGALLALAQGMTTRWMRDDALQLLRLVVGEVVRLPELRDGIREVFPGQLLAQVEGLIRSADDAGIVDAPHPDLSARMFLGPVMTFVSLDGLLRADSVAPPDSRSLAYIVDAFLVTIRVGGGPR